MAHDARSDADLISAWTTRRDEASFHALVSRYAGLVHSAARRTCGNESLAAEASQLTFILLARKAAALTGRPSLAGWLHLAARRQAKDLLRQNRRESLKRERLAMDTSNHSHDDSWRDLQPVLDDALVALSDKDREALLLRFYRSFSVREVAAALGIGTDAAQKRIDRATERLRGKLARRGVQTGGALSATLLAGFAADAQAATPTVSMLASKAIAAGTVGTGGLTGLLALTVAVMKTSSLIPPAIALIAAAFWTGAKYQSLQAMAADNARLRERIEAAESGVSPQTAKTPATKADAPINWRLLATEQRYGPETTRFTKKLPAMSWQELVSTLDKIAALECSDERRTDLEAAAVGVMGNQNPEWVLHHFADRLREPPNDRRLPLRQAFDHWLDTDFNSAKTWFEQVDSTGGFRAKSLGRPDEPRAPFEAALLFREMSADPAAASGRLSKLPDESLPRVMSELRRETMNLPPEKRGDPEFARLVRQSFPPAEQSKWFFENGPYFTDAGYYPTVNSYLDRIEATPAERADYLERFAGRIINRTSSNRKISDTDIETARGWFRDVAPDAVDAMTGRALVHAMANRTTSMRLAQASEIAVRLLDETGSDEALAILLECADLDKSEQQPALELADRISSATRRAAVIARLESLEFP